MDKGRIRLGIDSRSFPDMGVRFSKDKDFDDGFSLVSNAHRYNKCCKCCTHTLSFCIGLTDGCIEVNEVLTLETGATTHPSMTCTASVQSQDFTVLQYAPDVSGHFIFRIELKSHKQFQKSLLTYRVMSKECATSMVLNTKQGVLSGMRYLEVRIPRKQKSDWMSEATFDQMQRVLKKLSSRISLTVSAPPTDKLTTNLNTTDAPIIDLTNIRRVQGADFGSDFMTFSAEEKISAIDKKIRAHVRDGQQLKECMEMVNDFERAVELDNAVGPLGIGNVTSQIYRMVKEEVPHEMLDLFLMMGRLRVQKRNESASKKRKWDITGF